MAIASSEAMATVRSSSRGATVAGDYCYSWQARKSTRLSLMTLPRGPSSSILQSSYLCCSTLLQKKHGASGGAKHKGKLHVSCSMLGEDPEWNDADYIVLGLAHCFQQAEGGKLQDVFLVEPVSASTLECLENGGATSYLHVTASTLGTAFKYDVSLLPPEFGLGRFCDDFEFRAKCASRTWKRPHAVKNLVHIVPSGCVRSEYNFSLTDKRVINKERVVTDSDNIKQDMSIDVYGRKTEEVAKDEASSQIASLYNT